MLSRSQEVSKLRLLSCLTGGRLWGTTIIVITQYTVLGRCYKCNIVLEVMTSVFLMQRHCHQPCFPSLLSWNILLPKHHFLPTLCPGDNYHWPFCSHSTIFFRLSQHFGDNIQRWYDMSKCHQIASIDHHCQTQLSLTSSTQLMRISSLVSRYLTSLKLQWYLKILPPLKSYLLNLWLSRA